MSDDDKCEGGWEITSGDCPKCGASPDNPCGYLTGTTYFNTEVTELARLRETQAVLVAALKAIDTLAVRHVAGAIGQAQKIARTAIASVATQ